MAEIGVGVVGTGFIGVVHVEALRRLGYRVCSVLGSSVQRARPKAEALGLPVYDSYAALLADPAVTAIHIRTRDASSTDVTDSERISRKPMVLRSIRFRSALSVEVSS